MKYWQHPAYQCWDSMKRRCSNPLHKDYPKYGARGITYPPEWNDFWIFIRDVGERPPGTTLDRLRGTESYSKENCRWATPLQQTLNTRINSRNTSGVKGVSWQAAQRKWLVSRALKGKRYTLYWGEDFFEACCAAKSWENSLEVYK